MKKIKYLGLCLVLMLSMFLVTGCGNKNIEGNLEDIMATLYESIPEDNTPGGLTNIEINDENVESFIGTKKVEYTEAIASESMMGSIAHSVILIRVKDTGKIEEYKDAIYESINPRKWVCVGVEKDEVVIENEGDLILVLVVQDEGNREKLEEAFDNLK